MTSTTDTTTGIQAVKNAVKQFEAAQNKYRTFGACDTEPDAIFQRILMNALEDKDFEIPQSGNDWELYTNSMNCDEAAAALHFAALVAVQAIYACTIKDRRDLERYIKSHCWRYN